MTRRNSLISDGQSIVGGARITQGGTGASSSQVALSNLGGVSVDLIDHALGPIPLDEHGLPSPSIFTGISVIDTAIDGERFIGIRETKEYFITTFDAFLKYVVEAIDGEVEIEGHVIRYTAPYRTGSSGFTVNGRLISIAVTGVTVGEPSITSPTENADNRPLSLSVLSSPFSFKGETDSHKSTDWEVSLDRGFGTLSASSYNDTFHLTFWEIMALKELTTHYVRCRYRSQSGSVSAWSNPRSFKTGNDGLINNENQVIPNPTGLPNQFFGWHAVYDGTGNTLYITSDRKPRNGLQNVGAVFVYKRDSAGLWAYLTEINIPSADLAANAYFGNSISVSADGAHLVVGTYYASGADGRVYYFTRSGDVWTHQQTLYPPVRNTDEYFSYYKITLSSDGNELIVGSIYYEDSAVVNTGCIYQYLRSGATWALNAQIKNNHPKMENNDNLGHYQAMSTDRQHLLVAAICGNYSGQTKSGYVNYYTKSGNNWVYQSRIERSDLPLAAMFGHTLSMSADGTRAVIFAPLVKKAYIYLRSGVTWTLEKELVDTNTKAFISGRVNISSDGLTAYFSTAYSDYPGVLYIYSRSSGSWVLTKTLTPVNSFNGDLFGRSTIAIHPSLQEIAVASLGGSGNIGSVSIFS